MHSSPSFDTHAECIFAAMAVSTLQKQLHAGGHTNDFFVLFIFSDFKDSFYSGG